MGSLPFNSTAFFVLSCLCPEGQSFGYLHCWQGSDQSSVLAGAIFFFPFFFSFPPPEIISFYSLIFIFVSLSNTSIIFYCSSFVKVSIVFLSNLIFFLFLLSFLFVFSIEKDGEHFKILYFSLKIILEHSTKWSSKFSIRFRLELLF